MHVLTILDHPDPQSFSGAVARSFMDGAKAAGHTTELADLHREGFNPLWGTGDIAANAGAAVPDDVRAEQVRIERADAICLVFPLFWWGMPAMMKGWMDRVWTWGWAYDQLADPEVSLLRKRSGVLLVPAGGNSEDMTDGGYAAALDTAWIEGTFGYFGLSPRKLELLCGSTGSEARRTALLQRSYQTGQTLAPPSDTAES